MKNFMMVTKVRGTKEVSTVVMPDKGRFETMIFYRNTPAAMHPMIAYSAEAMMENHMKAVEAAGAGRVPEGYEMTNLFDDAE